MERQRGRPVRRRPRRREGRLELGHAATPDARGDGLPAEAAGEELGCRFLRCAAERHEITNASRTTLVPVDEAFFVPVGWILMVCAPVVSPVKLRVNRQSEDAR